MTPSASSVNCVLIGHKYAHEVQVVAQMFFGGWYGVGSCGDAGNVRFVFCEKIPPTGLAVAGILNGTSCTGELYLDGKKTASHTMDSPKEEKAIKRTLMLVLFYALKEATGQPTPWGALTGVRPAKQVRIWMDEKDTTATITERLRTVYECREDKIKLAIEVARAEAGLIAGQKPGVGLYIGIPFCPSRCMYCSFVTGQKADADAPKRYLAALAKECKTIAAKQINTIYIGGGTPTALSEEDLAALLKIVSPFANGQEYTVEAGRPDSITKEKLTLLKAYGVNRIAINPQTLNDETLVRIGRAHTSADFYKAYEMAVQAGFTNINTDVIAGLPGEKTEDVRRTMEGLKKLSPPHITVHTLAVKRASRLNEHRLQEIPDYGTVDRALDIARKVCEDLGLAPYYMYRQKNMVGHFENVGFSLPGYECLYNVAMMAETQTVLAAGAGAVTKIVEDTRIERKFNPKDIETYIKKMSPDYK